MAQVRQAKFVRDATCNSNQAIGSNQGRAITTKIYKGGRRMKTSCRLFAILVIAAVFSMRTAAFAEPSTPPATQTLELALQTPLWNYIQVWHVLVGVYFLAVIVLFWICSILNKQRLAREEQYRVCTRRHKCLHSALTLKLDTDNFSDAACWEAAYEDPKRILKRRDEIQDAEAKRLLCVKEDEYAYRQIAAYAATITDLSETEVIDMLRQADAWDYRVLSEAELQRKEAVS